MKFTYWNTQKIDAFDRIIDIVQKEDPCLFFLSEFDLDCLTGKESKLLEHGYELYDNPGCKRVSILKRVGFEVELSLQNKFYTTTRIKKDDLYVVSLHLPSQMWQSMASLKEFLRDLRITLDEEIGSSSDAKILLIGDFNVNPYESPMIDYDGFVSTNSPKAKHTINYLGKSRTTYYNPTWELYSRTNFPGTKQFSRPSASSYDVLEFHYLDQVVISQKLLMSIVEHKIDIIEETENFTFFNHVSNKVEGSDHLPITYKIKF